MVEPHGFLHSTAGQDATDLAAGTEPGGGARHGDAIRDQGLISGAAAESGALLTETAAMQAMEWLGHEHRRLRRFPVQASRAIALRELDSEHVLVGRWLPVDILDISSGGMCLMVSDVHHFQNGQHLMLDVRSHPGFGLLRLEVEVRWCCHSLSFTTFGVSFLEPLAEVPRLELERRTARLDPNNEAWAQD